MANSTCLALVQGFCRQYGLPVPTALQGVTDAGALQMRELLNSVGEDVREQTNWQQCARRASWASAAGADQGTLATLFPYAFDKIIPRTFWNETVKQPYAGPISHEGTQINTAYGLATPSYYFSVSNGHLYTQATQVAADTLSLWYNSLNWVATTGATSANPANAQFFALDDDTCIWPDALMKKGLRAYWLRLKQMPHKLEMEQFEDALINLGSVNTVAPILRMDNGGSYPRAGVVIPLGNWTI